MDKELKANKLAFIVYGDKPDLVEICQTKFMKQKLCATKMFITEAQLLNHLKDIEADASSRKPDLIVLPSSRNAEEFFDLSYPVIIITKHDYKGKEPEHVNLIQMGSAINTSESEMINAINFNESIADKVLVAAKKIIIDKIIGKRNAGGMSFSD